MRKKEIIFTLLLSSLLLIACSKDKVFGKGTEIRILRFDQDLHQYLSGTTTQEEIVKGHKAFLDLFGEEVIGIGRSDSAGFFSRLQAYFSHDELKKIYLDELNTFKDISKLEEELSSGFDFLQTTFDSLSIPSIYIHTSGLQQNMVASDKILAISADKYLGTNYPIYKQFFYEYQRQNMYPERLAPDLLLGFLMSSFPFPQQGDLLDRMLYEGKLRYILSLALPAYSDAEIIGYSMEQEDWSKKQEAAVWRKIIQEKHLFSKDKLIIDKYINDAPYTSTISNDSPGRLGIWVGYQIIRSYAKEAGNVSLQDLIRVTNSQEILRISKYKP